MTAPCPDGDCPGCREWHAIHTRLCPEVPRDVREEQRKRDRKLRRYIEERELSTAFHRLPTGCAEIGSDNCPTLDAEVG